MASWTEWKAGCLGPVGAWHWVDTPYVLCKLHGWAPRPGSLLVVRPAIREDPLGTCPFGAFWRSAWRWEVSPPFTFGGSAALCAGLPGAL